MSSKKGKGKRPNKPPNLNPPQVKEEIAQEKEEKLHVSDIVESENEQRVPEIISDIPNIATEVKDDSNTPKKPKRNRGKKKKQDKDAETEETNVDKLLDSVLEQTIPVVVDEIKVEEIELMNEAATAPEIPDITPTARKKKNKNKKNLHELQQFEDLVSEKEKEVTEISKNNTNLIPSELLNTVKTVEQTKNPELPVETVEEIKPSKKKNKRKTHHDSDKILQKEEQSYTTTTQNQLKEESEVFIGEDLSSQNIESINEEKKAQKIEKKLEEISASILTKEHPEEAVKDTCKVEQTNTPELPHEAAEEVKSSKKKNKRKKHDSDILHLKEEQSCTTTIQNKLNEESELFIAEDLSTEKIQDQKMENKLEEIPSSFLTQEIPEEVVLKDTIKDIGTKNKKKKKDKRNILKEDELQIGQEIGKHSETETEDIKSSSTDLISSIHFDEENTDNNLKKDEALQQLEENILKPKAKIIKPVDKKSDKKSDQSFKDSLPKEVIVSESPLDKTITSLEVKVTESHEKDIATTKSIKSLDTGNESTPTRIEKVKQKREKSPKLPTATMDKEVIQSIQDAQKDIIQVSTDIATDIQLKVTSQTVQPETEQFLKEKQEMFKEVDNQLLNKSEFKDDRTSHESKTDILPKTSKGKKNKKLPKPPVKLEDVQKKLEESKNKDEATENKEKSKAESGDVSEEVFYDLPSPDEIDIKSVKADESEGSVSEITPDCIQYPRAISQQNTDNNNNTVIQELLITEESNLQIPNILPDTPFIDNSKDILTSPILLVPDLEIASGSDVSTPTVKNTDEKQEKTDLKSKMIEVNQDMEELRLSIEKSLAELTSLEKSDDKIEKTDLEQNQPIPDEKCTGDDFIDLIEEIEDKERDVQSTVISEEINVLPTVDDNKIIETIPFEKAMESLPTNLEDKSEIKSTIFENIATDSNVSSTTHTLPTSENRKDNKGKSKSKKKGKQEQGSNLNQSKTTGATSSDKCSSESSKTEQKSEQKTDKSQEKSKQQSVNIIDDLTEANNTSNDKNLVNFEPIDNFEDAMTSSLDDVNKTFEIIADDAQNSQVNSEININVSVKEKNKEPNEKINPVSQPKNLLGHPDIPVSSNRTDYKKEKNKPPNAILAKVKIKDSVQIENRKQSKESQTNNIKNLMKKKTIDEPFSSMINETDEYIYKYTFRKVFLPNVCHICKKDLKQSRISCSYCNLLFYCCPKHKDEGWAQHQALCFAVSTVGHLRDQKHIYADARNITGQNYRLLRMQMIVACEKVLKRKLVPWEQEMLLYPRICSDIGCREWRQNMLEDCDGCGQVSYCRDHPEHLPKSHQRWCKSYSLYQKLVCYQQTQGRLEPKLPNRVMIDQYYIPEKINEVLATIYKDKIDMNDVEYAALTQLATAPLTTAYSHQLYTSKLNSTYANGVVKKSSFTIHVVGAELQFEADVLNKWEVFFLHLRPDVQHLRIVLIAPDLNPSNLPLDLLQKIKLCEECQQYKRRMLFNFEDKKTYHEYYDSIDFATPDIVCAFNASIQRSSTYNGTDSWPSTINCILKLKTPFVLTSYTLDELRRDLTRIEEVSGFELNLVAEPRRNPFASVRPDRNFITDDEMPLLFKNYCFSVICGVF
ncbi:FK506-binding protein 5 [Achroia grisella]|uniref:FK506-binding protein 5 n=1 Tax=Achroia grisella TaxID=688607 RepID=UPI0027D2C486|nr:FK506-binding protein 5 [Achroia grisella]